MLGTGGPTDGGLSFHKESLKLTKRRRSICSLRGLGYEGKSGDLMLDENGAVDLGENINPEKSKFCVCPMGIVLNTTQ